MSLIVLFVKFGMVGGLGTLTNLLVFYMVSDLGGLDSTISSIIAFSIAVTQNYLLNHIWTFRKIHADEPLSFRRYFKYVAVSLGGLAVNLIVLAIVLRLWIDIPLTTIAQAIGIVFGMVVNFIGSKIFVFRRTERKD